MSKDKPYTPRFYAENAEMNAIDRVPVFRDIEVTSIHDMHPNITRTQVGETVTVTVRLMSSGNTTEMTGGKICAWVLKKINS